MKAAWSRKKVRIAAVAAAVVIVGPLAVRLAMHLGSESREFHDVSDAPSCRVALVLGTSPGPHGQVTGLLADRVQTAVDLYQAGKVKKLLMSGDNRRPDYNEPLAMARYAQSMGVPSKDITMDFAGRRTYDSVYRAKHIFGLRRIAVVTEEFHLDRSLFLCRHLGVDAFGVAGHSPVKLYTQAREVAACVAAVIDVYVRHPIPVMGHSEPI